jgi:long-chain acyl-CoA synthetase
VVPVIVPRATPPHKLADLRSSHAGFGFFNGEDIELPAVLIRAADPRIFLAMMTSGSTGTPKLVAIDHENLVNGIYAIHSAQSLQSVTSTAILLPLAYSYALVNQLLWAVLYCRHVRVLPGLIDPLRTLEIIHDQRIEMLCLVGYQLRTLSALGLTQTSLECVRVVNFAGAPFPSDAFESLQRLFPRARFFNNYGCTEAMPRLTVARVTDRLQPNTLVGPPIHTIELRIASAEPIGPIEFRGSSTSIGFVQPDGSLLEHGTWIASGDLGRLDDGLLSVLGRHDQIVKIAGERFSLIEIENSLLRAGFSQVLAWQDSTEPDGRILCVVPGASEISPAQFVAHLRRCLSQPLWPRTVYTVDEWPLLANGKTDRTALQHRARSGELRVLFPPKSVTP